MGIPVEKQSDPVVRGRGRIEVVIVGAAAILLALRCLLILRPFISAALWAAILCFTTWPLFLRLEQMVGGRRALAALIATLALTMTIAAPFLILGWLERDMLPRPGDELPLKQSRLYRSSGRTARRTLVFPTAEHKSVEAALRYALNPEWNRGLPNLQRSESLETRRKGILAAFASLPVRLE